MNIILNSYCNLKCNYCFADEYMEENVKTPDKSMDYDFFQNELLPRVKNASLINFMGGEPTLHPRFNEYAFQNFGQYAVLLISWVVYQWIDVGQSSRSAFKFSWSWW